MGVSSALGNKTTPLGFVSKDTVDFKQQTHFEMFR